jgi:hypothetical protein
MHNGNATPAADSTVPPCPAWCALPPGHAEYDTDGTMFREHVRPVEQLALGRLGETGRRHLHNLELRQLEHQHHDRGHDLEPVAITVSRPIPEDLSPTEALRLLPALAAAVEGTTPNRPPQGPGPQRHHGRPVMPRVLHDAWCVWRMQSPDDERPDLTHCAGCGLIVALPAGATTR